MQNFNFENKLLSPKNKNEIKFLWRNNFCDDDETTINYFLENVFENKKGVGAFLNNELIAMILFLNSKIISKNKNKKAVYFYAVCTDEKYRKKGVMKTLFSFATQEAKKQGFEICFLVPENEGLFKMYEKFSFERTINYEEKCISRNDIDVKNTIKQKTDFCYSDYLNIKLKASVNHPVVVWEEDEFNFIFNKNRSDVSFIFINSGFAIYEKTDNEMLVYEICGDEDEIVNSLFNKYCDCERIILRAPSEKCKSDFGMTLNLSDNETETQSIYFGMPYG